MSQVSADVPEEGVSTAEFRAMWRRQEPFWHGAFAIVWASAVVVTVLDERGPHGLWPSVLLLVAMAVAYATLGVRGIRQQQRAGVTYQVVAWSLLLLIQLVDPGTETWMLYFILYPQMWAMLEVRWAAVGTLLSLAVFGGVRFWQSGFDSDALGAILISSVISLGISTALGIFINRIVDEAQSRAETIDELQATQARLAAVERDRGVQDERERISREIHDTLAQGFTSVVTLTRAADAALARGDVATARERLSLVERTATDNLAEARLIVAELTPGHLQSRTLVEAMQRLGEAVSSETGMRAEVTVDGEPAPLGGVAEVVLLRTAQEALSNVRRHASAGHVAVSLAYEPERVVLTVCDDGRGFDTGADRRGFGLDGVRARAAQVGGEVDLTSVPGSGTTLRLEVPR
ncbi:sensor histidine kinase [Phycicoccus sp. MAQZ13P-2]|uniref:sensor histidine kinase n=1 Tax=Phycicoccus mangrovi TaxID=2840470 RepID=UPI001BFFF8B1|nr:sensor histidine kinase [Phycicoccus mangrovi]MBT9256697.1 sensor histidine kinase [Phycicoccus mangrovi]MBT9274739.1 sensor histidine kinase [Phycicoccus mangrovi]